LNAFAGSEFALLMLRVNASLAAAFHGLGYAFVEFVQMTVHGCSIWGENTAVAQNTWVKLRADPPNVPTNH
jgi:hypothetical protein